MIISYVYILCNDQIFTQLEISISTTLNICIFFVKTFKSFCGRYLKHNELLLAVHTLLISLPNCYICPLSKFSSAPHTAPLACGSNYCGKKKSTSMRSVHESDHTVFISLCLAHRTEQDVL